MTGWATIPGMVGTGNRPYRDRMAPPVGHPTYPFAVMIGETVFIIPGPPGDREIEDRAYVIQPEDVVQVEGYLAG
jgi:hypothetical protein